MAFWQTIILTAACIAGANGMFGPHYMGWNVAAEGPVIMQLSFIAELTSTSVKIIRNTQAGDSYGSAKDALNRLSTTNQTKHPVYVVPMNDQTVSPQKVYLEGDLAVKGTSLEPSIEAPYHSI